MDELKSCPFCGGKASLVTYHNRACTWVRYYVRCERCLVHQHNHETPQIAIEAWNKRVEIDPVKLVEIDHVGRAEDGK